MKKLSFLFLLLNFFSCLFGQSLKKYAIGESGCSAYFFCDPAKFDVNFSEDSSKIYTSECNNDSCKYGLICVELKEVIPELPEAENMLVSYLDYLKSFFKITSSAGYGKGHKLKDREDTRGIIDYWKDADNNNWKIKGWTDGKWLVVLYVNSLKELNETKVNVFLDGLLLGKK